MIKSRAFILRFMFLLVPLFLVGCAILVKEGTLITPGTSIEAIDGSFRIESGQSFNTPFHSKDCGAWKGVLDAADYKTGIGCGGKRVLVRAYGLSEPLYGVLMFLPLPPTATGPASRSYQLEIPQNYIEAAEGGKVSVVYESAAAIDGSYIAWILWLSDSALW